MCVIGLKEKGQQMLTNGVVRSCCTLRDITLHDRYLTLFLDTVHTQLVVTHISQGLKRITSLYYIIIDFMSELLYIHLKNLSSEWCATGQSGPVSVLQREGLISLQVLFEESTNFQTLSTSCFPDGPVDMDTIDV